jgi:NAD(P)-dependent dehydrogenase (short-subunit alcohol dehydrogenase family)
MVGKLEGQVAFVTGAASGIGRATARLLAVEGAAVAAVDRDESGVSGLVVELTELGVPCRALPADLADIGALPDLVGVALEAFGRIDILVNAAGVTGDGTGLLDMGEGNWELVHRVNLEAPFVLMREVGRHMVARGGGGGKIVNVSSSSAFRAMQSNTAYGSSKAGLVQLTRSAAAELGRHDINVNAVAPGLTDTAMTAPMFRDPDVMQRAVTRGPLANVFRRPSAAADVAEVIVFLCLPAARQITAQTIHTSAGAVIS